MISSRVQLWLRVPLWVRARERSKRAPRFVMIASAKGWKQRMPYTFQVDTEYMQQAFAWLADVLPCPMSTLKTPDRPPTV